MADTGNHGHRACRNGTRQAFIVERHEAFERAASAQQQDNLHARIAQKLQGVGHITSGRGALNGNARNHHARQGKPPAERAQGIVDHSAVRRRYDAHRKRDARDRAFARRVHQAFGLKLLGKLSHLLAQGSFARELDTVHVEVELARTGEDAELAR